MSRREAVFVDVDETLIRCKSMLDFLRYYYCRQSWLNCWGRLRFFSVKLPMMLAARIGVPRAKLNRYYYRRYRQVNYASLQSYGQDWFRSRLNAGDFFRSSVLLVIKQHQQQGAKVVLVSGSFLPLLQPISDYVGADAIRCTDLVLRAGVLTGELQAEPMISGQKALAAKAYCHEHEFSLSQAYAYGDHHSDMPLLELVANPVVVAAAKPMRDIARQRGWAILD
jgi:HAD superfamily hydrolase (TIGR01490 family)